MRPNRLRRGTRHRSTSESGRIWPEPSVLSGRLRSDELVRNLPRELFRRRLGLPPEFPAEPRIDSLAESCRTWYGEHGSPWRRGFLIELRELDAGEITLSDGQIWRSPLLARGFLEAEVEAVIVLAVSAGEAIDAAVDRHWREERPDEAMFLNAYGIAVAEHLRHTGVERLRECFSRIDRTILPPYSPGYEGWGLEDQAALFRSLDDPGPLRVLPSGGLKPSKSTLAAIGVTPRPDLVDPLDGFWSDRRCGHLDADHHESVGRRELSWRACPGCPNPDTCQTLQICGSVQTSRGTES